MFQIGAQRAASINETAQANKASRPDRGLTMPEKKEQVKAAPKKACKKTLKGAKKLGETKLMMTHPGSH
jgi:hypothetical protein